MSFDFNIRISDMVFHITSNYRPVIRYCGLKFLTRDEAQHHIPVSLDDIVNERQLCERDQTGIDPYLLTAPDYHLEIVALLRKLADYIVDFDRILMHGSSIAVDGNGYIFTAVSGTGKSTHTKLLRELLGDRAVMVNDDKPFLRIDGDQVFVCGSPWMGKHSLGDNICAPLKGIFFLRRSETNELKPITPEAALSLLLAQVHRPVEADKMLKTLDILDRLLKLVPLYDFACNMDISAAELSSSVM